MSKMTVIPYKLEAIINIGSATKKDIKATAIYAAMNSGDCIVSLIAFMIFMSSHFQ